VIILLINAEGTLRESNEKETRVIPLVSDLRIFSEFLKQMRSLKNKKITKQN